MSINLQSKKNLALLEIIFILFKKQYIQSVGQPARSSLPTSTTEQMCEEWDKHLAPRQEIFNAGESIS